MAKRSKRRKGPVYQSLVPTSQSRKLDMKLIDEMCAIIERGNFRYVACHRAGVSLRRFSYWLEIAKKERSERDEGDNSKVSLHVHLLERIEQAEGELHSDCIEDILESDDARLKLEYLKLRYGKAYSGNPNARLDDENGTETKVDARELLRERLLAILGPPEDG